MSDKVYLGSGLADLDIGEKTEQISRVNLLVDGQTMYTAGDDTGRTIEKSIPWASQNMANDILASLRGVCYRPFSGVDALIDPSVEIGDGITVGGIYSVLAKKSTDYGKMSTSSISAPESDEIEDEYPYISKRQRDDNRKLAQTYSYIKKTSDEIELVVANEVEGLHSEISQTASSLQSQITTSAGDISTLKQTATSLQTQISTANGNISKIEQYAKSLTLSVSNGSTSSTIKLMAGATEIDSENITFTGFVTFTGLSGGTTTIDGSCIKTGTIDAERLNLTGAITWDNLSGGVQEDINEAASIAKQIADGEYSGTFIDGTSIYSPDIHSNNLTVYSSETSGGFSLHGGRYNMFEINYYGPNYVTFESPAQGALEINMPTYFIDDVTFEGNVSGVSSFSLSDKNQSEAFSAYSINRKEEKTIDFEDENGVLKITLPTGAWYLDETGWHQ